MKSLVKGKYRPYKGHLYEVIDIAKNSENLEEMVVYRALYDDFCLWVRPLQMFVEEVRVNDKVCKRFEFIDHSIS
jgi:hypothetical protein